MVETANLGTRNTELIIETASTHNTYSTAQSITDDNKNIGVLQGTLSSHSEQDWYKIKCPISGKLAVVLGCPAGCDYNVYVYDSNGSTLLASGSSHTAGYGEYCVIGVSSTKEYYIKVVSNGTTLSPVLEYYLYAFNTAKKAWYSQFNSNVLGYGYWNTYKLDKLYFKGCSGNLATTPFMVDSSSPRIMKDGCAICAYAMVLKNLGATTTANIHDFRTGYYGKAIPDPFTLTLCNVSITDNPISSGGEYHYNKVLTKTPVYISNHDALVNAFGYTEEEASGTSIDTIKTLLKSHPEGVIVKF